jgi:hypothetical protein
LLSFGGGMIGTSFHAADEIGRRRCSAPTVLLMLLAFTSSDITTVLASEKR